MQRSAPLEPESWMNAGDQHQTGPTAQGHGEGSQGNDMALQRFESIKPGSIVLIESRDGTRTEKYFVRNSTRTGGNHSIRLVRGPVVENEAAPTPAPVEPDYYDVLQIGPQAEAETIYRVYRIMAARFHPDNPETGDTEKFLLLKTAYEVLSDPELRAAYDARHQQEAEGPMPIFELKDFVTGVEAEGNRRLGVLSLLYNQRRLDSEHPQVSLLDMERRMNFPREYLAFTMWYLRAKGYLTAADNSDYTMTAEGAEFVEANIGKSEILAKLLFPDQG